MSTEDKKIQLGVEVDATAARSGFAEVKAGAKDMAQAVATAGQQGAKGLDGIGAGGDAAAAKVDKATRSMIQSVQRATAALQAGEKGGSSYFETLAAQRGVSGDVLKPYIEQLKAAEAAQQAASGSLNKMGVSAAQTAAAMRQVPAQFTDIIVSLQSGQAPLTVLLQQGGQLKDTFGGVGNAARALGGYMAGLLSPLTLVAGAAAALGLAYYKGDQEARAFNRTLIETGGASGRTVGELSTMAREMSNLGTTQANAAEGLAAFLSIADLGAQRLQRFTLAAIQLEDAGGSAVSETAKAFAELGKAPLEASVKLNESMNYLTQSVYDQIKALDGQGKAAEAARVAQDAFATAIENRAPAMLQNLGYIERAWAGIKDAVKGAGDAMLNVGRSSTPQEDLAAKQARLANAEASRALARSRGISVPTTDSKEMATLREEIAQGQKRLAIGMDVAAAEADRTRQLKAGIEWDKEGVKYLDKKAQMQKELARVRNEGLAAGKSEEEIAKRIAAITEKYTEKTPKAPKFKLDAFNAESLKVYTQSMDELERIQIKATASAEGLSNTQEALRKIQSSPEWSQFNFRKQEEIILAASLAQAAEDEVEAKKQAKAATEEYATALEAQQKAATGLQDQVAKEREQVAAIGLTKEAVAELAVARMEELALTKERLAAILPETEQGKAMAQAYREQAAALREMAGLKREGAAKEVAVDAAKKAAEEWKRTAEQIESSITDSLMRGFESGKGFAESLRDTVVNMFKTLVLRPIVSAVVSPVAAALAGGLGASGAAAAGQGGAAGALGQVGAASNTLSGANTLASMKGWLTDFGGGVSSQVSKLGNYLSSFSNSTVSEWGNGLMENATAIGDYAQVAGNALGYFNAAMAASEGKWGQAVGTAVGTYFGGPIGAAIGGAVGGWIDNAFGGGREYTTGQGITGTFSSSGFSGQNYQTWRNDGSSGFFGFGASGSSSGTNYSALDSSTASGLSKAFQAVQAQTADFAESLGLSADTIQGFSKSITLALGADAEANKTAIQNLLAGIADDLAKTVLDSQYIREGEAAASTLARLATNLAAVNGAFDGLGKTALSTSQFGGDAASKLVDLLGGLSAFQSTTLAYYQTYYTEQERNAKTSEQLAKSFADLGIAVPGSLEAFRNLVNAQDVTTESGRATYAALMSLSTAFATVTTAAADAASSLIVAAKYSTYADYAAAAAGAGLTPTPRFAAGGMHSGGLRIVGENGPELEATGPSRIWNDSQIRGALAGGDSAGVAAAIERLDANMQAQASATVRLQNAMVKIFDRWDLDGLPEVRPA